MLFVSLIPIEWSSTHEISCKFKFKDVYKSQTVFAHIKLILQKPHWTNEYSLMRYAPEQKNIPMACFQLSSFEKTWVRLDWLAQMYVQAHKGVI